MAIITISRQLGSRGNEVAEDLARDLGYTLMTKELFSDMLRESGYSDKGGNGKVSAEERPSFLSSFVFNRDRVVYYIKKVLYDFARQDDVIIMGMGGQILFHTVPNSLRVRIMAPLNVRIDRVKEKYSCSDSEARSIIDESDHARSNFNEYFFGVDWEFASHYDLLINTENLAPVGIIRLIQDEVKRFESAGRKKELSKKLNDLELVQRVKIGILYENKLNIPNLDVRVTNGAITLSGSTQTIKEREDCATAARMIDGVNELINNVVALPPSFRA